jgi:hypothetical protein
MMLLLLTAGFLVALAGAYFAGRAQGGAASEKVRTRILPYLRRKAAEASLEVRPEDPRATAAETLELASQLAEDLLKKERHELALGNTLEIPRS